jgi:hypothetical protein
MPVHFANSEHLKAWQRIYDDLTWVEAGPGDEGNIDATIKRMIDGDARNVADAILALFHDLSAGSRYQPRLRVIVPRVRKPSNRSREL